MKPFTGTSENKVDTKGRVSVPAKFRAALADGNHAGIVVRPDPERGCLEGYGPDRLERLMGDMPDILDPTSPENAVYVQIMSESVELNFDPNGRVVLPADLMASAGITDTAVFVGLGRIFQIWSPAGHTRFREETRNALKGRGK